MSDAPQQATGWRSFLRQLLGRGKKQTATPWEIGGPGRRPKDSLPPKRTFTCWVILIAADITIFIAGSTFLILAGYAALNRLKALPAILANYDFVAYLAPTLLFLSVGIDRILRHQQKVHKARLEDRSEVERIFLDPALSQELTGPIVTHLKKLGPEGWTEYEVLPLRQLLVEKSPSAYLVQMAHTILLELKEYAEDAKYEYDTELYRKWETTIDLAITDYERDAPPTPDAELHLRAVIRTAYEHLIDYEMKWAEGSAMVRGLLTVVAVGGVAALYSGLLPFVYSDREFGIVNWMVLGAAGALMAVLRNLWNADATEVGNTQGRKEIWRAVSGGALGLMTGALMYGLAAAGLLPPPLSPDLTSHALADTGKAILWAMFAGYFVESAVERALNPLKSA